MERPSIFVEEQGFSAWMKAISLLPVIIFGVGAVLMWLGRPPLAVALAFSAVALVLVFLAVPNFVLKLVTTVDASRLRIRLVPLGLPVPFLPPRIRDVPLADVARWEVATYNAVTDRRYWGKHFWGLASASHGRRSMYVMKAGAARGRGVQLQLRGGDEVFLGSQRPGELADAIARAKGDAGRPATST